VRPGNVRDLSEWLGPREVVAAAALVAAGLERGDAIRAEIIERGCEATLLSPGSSPALAASR